MEKHKHVFLFQSTLSKKKMTYLEMKDKVASSYRSQFIHSSQS